MNPVDRIARMAEVDLWVASGIDLVVEPPNTDHADFMAGTPEFGLTAHGDTEQEAIHAMFAALDRIIEAFVNEGQPLPVRDPTREPSR